MNSSSDAMLVVAPIMILLAALFGLAFLILAIVIWCKIFAKAGYGWAFGLLMFVPIANIIMIFVLAFGDWPVQRQLRMVQQQMQQMMAQRPPQPQPAPLPH